MNLKQRLKNGEKIFGTMMRVVRNPAVNCLIKNSGLDFVMYDCEHADYNMETLHDLFVSGQLAGVDSFLRVPGCTKEWISRSLDQGASGVMVPMTDTKEIAETLVKYSKYQPLGGRGYAGGIAHSAYKGGVHEQVMKEANEKVISIAQIETTKALNHLDDIAGTDGIDALLVGPNDLSIALGIPGDLMNPIEIDAIRNVAAACKKHGKAFGLHAGPAMLKLFRDDLNLVMMQSDIDFLSAGFSSVKKCFL